jgi:hypothetical protein
MLTSIVVSDWIVCHVRKIGQHVLFSRSINSPGTQLPDEPDFSRLSDQRSASDKPALAGGYAAAYPPAAKTPVNSTAQAV